VTKLGESFGRQIRKAIRGHPSITSWIAVTGSYKYSHGVTGK
jgi:hypothetical protein